MNDEEILENRRALDKQIFQLQYFGKLNAEYTTNLEIAERNYMYQLLVDQLEEEKKQRDKEEQKAKSGAGRVPSTSRARR